MAYLYSRTNNRDCSLIGGSQKNRKSCSLKYKTRKIIEIFYKNRVYRFAVSNFSIFGINIKTDVRMFLTINIWSIYTVEQIREIVRWLAVRENTKKLFAKVQN